MCVCRLSHAVRQAAVVHVAIGFFWINECINPSLQEYVYIITTEFICWIKFSVKLGSSQNKLELLYFQIQILWLLKHPAIKLCVNSRLQSVVKCISPSVRPVSFQDCPLPLGHHPPRLHTLNTRYCPSLYSSCNACSGTLMTAKSSSSSICSNLSSPRPAIFTNTDLWIHCPGRIRNDAYLHVPLRSLIDIGRFTVLWVWYCLGICCQQCCILCMRAYLAACTRDRWGYEGPRAASEFAAALENALPGTLCQRLL